LDDDDQAKEIYAYFGLAIYFAQVMEQHAINMIVIKRITGPKIKTVDQADNLWDDYDMSKRTFGVLVNEIKQLFDLTVEDETELEEFKKLRNYIAHDYFRFNSDLFYNEDGKRRMIKDFIGFKEKAKKIDNMLTGYFKKYQEHLGLTDDKVEEMMETMMKEAKTMTVDNNYKTIKK